MVLDTNIKLYVLPVCMFVNPWILCNLSHLSLYGCIYSTIFWMILLLYVQLNCKAYIVICVHNVSIKISKC